MQPVSGQAHRQRRLSDIKQGEYYLDSVNEIRSEAARIFSYKQTFESTMSKTLYH